MLSIQKTPVAKIAASVSVENLFLRSLMPRQLYVSSPLLAHRPYDE